MINQEHGQTTAERMVVISLFVLAVVILETTRATVQAWKVSPLAHLMADADGFIMQDVGGAEVGSVKGVEKVVGRRRVVLEN